MYIIKAKTEATPTGKNSPQKLPCSKLAEEEFDILESAQLDACLNHLFAISAILL